MKITFFSLLVLVAVFMLVGSVSAKDASLANVNFPVKELGNCANEEACKVYCDAPSHLEACLIFAEKNNLMSEAELSQAKKFLDAGSAGPGGCTSKTTCERYCNDIKNIDECVAFAETHDLLPPDELAEARKVKDAIDRGIQPPACGSKKDCDSYCSSPEHMEECLTFAEKAGFLPEDELVEAKKVLQAVKKGVKPPACRGKAECENYCTQEQNFTECVTFAEAAGLMSSEELEMFKKTGGKGPGGCRGKEACDAFCESNMDVCVNFAMEHGLMDAKDAEMAKKTGGKGPGGCRGKDECESFCNDPANQESCFNFAKDNGLMSEEELRNMEDGREKTKEMFTDVPAEIRDCLVAGVGEEVFTKLKSGTFFPSREIGDKMGECFRKMGPPPGMEGQRPESSSEGVRPFAPGGAPERFQGPGGCSSPEECQAYCQNNPQACGRMPADSGGFPPQGDRLPPSSEMPFPGSGDMPSDGQRPADFPQQFQERYREEFQRQYQEQYQEQIQRIPEGYQIPEVQTLPLNFVRPEEMIAPPPPTQEMMQPVPTVGTPPLESAPPPPPVVEPAPQSGFVDKFFASIVDFFR